MTKSQLERIAVVEQKVDNVDRKIDEYFKESREFHAEMLGRFENLDERYPTRREFKAANLVFTLMVTLLGVALSLYTYVTNK